MLPTKASWASREEVRESGLLVQSFLGMYQVR